MSNTWVLRTLAKPNKFQYMLNVCYMILASHGNCLHVWTSALQISILLFGYVWKDVILTPHWLKWDVLMESVDFSENNVNNFSFYVLIDTHGDGYLIKDVSHLLKILGAAWKAYVEQDCHPTFSLLKGNVCPNIITYDRTEPCNFLLVLRKTFSSHIWASVYNYGK